MRQELKGNDDKMAALRNESKRAQLEAAQQKEAAESNQSSLSKAQSCVRELQARVDELEAEIARGADHGVSSAMATKLASEIEELRAQLKAAQDAKSASEAQKNEMSSSSWTSRAVSRSRRRPVQALRHCGSASRMRWQS